MDWKYKTVIVHRATGEVVIEARPGSLRFANQVADGMSINLNHDEYVVRVVPVAEGETE